MPQPLRIIRRTLLLTSLTILLFFTFIQTSSAQIKTFYWERFDVDMTLLSDGNLRIVETQTLVFSGEPFTFGFGTIYTGSKGNNDGIVDVSVTENGIEYTESNSERPSTFKLSEENDEVIIEWFFSPTTGRATYVFSYTVLGAVRVGTLEEGSGDQIFWLAIPEDHSSRIDNSRVTINLPPGVTPQQFTGTTDYLVEASIDGRENTVAIDVINDGSTIVYEATEPILAYDEMTVRVQFPHGILDISKPGWQRREEIGDAVGLGFLAISVLLLITGPIGVLVLWYVRGRDPKLSVVVPDYITEPPTNLSPALVGTLIDERADIHDILSMLIDLSERGFMTIKEEATDFVFSRASLQTGQLSKFEEKFLQDIFGGKEQRKLSALRYKFSSKLPRLRKMLYEEMVEKGYAPESPESVRNRYSIFAVLSFVVAGVLFFATVALSSEDSIGYALCLPFSVGLTGVVLFIVARFMPHKTAKGAEEAAKWLAFKKYLQNIERQTDIAQATELFEKYLAYATAFGLERSWIRKFERAGNTPQPGWYIPGPRRRRRPFFGTGPIIGGGTAGAGGIGGSSGGGGLEGMSEGVSGGLQGMSDGLTRMLNSSNNILQSVKPSSSSSSGGFSGGFSGGSAGGGGSRGFG